MDYTTTAATAIKLNVIDIKEIVIFDTCFISNGKSLVTVKM